MPGKRYDLHILKGPFAGNTARLADTPSHLPAHARVEVKNLKTRDGQPINCDLPWEWLEKLQNKTTRPSAGIFPAATPATPNDLDSEAKAHARAALRQVTEEAPQ